MRRHTCLGLLGGHSAHVLGVQLHGVIAQLGFGSRLEVVAAHRKVTVPLHPPENENESKVREDSETKPKSQEGGKAGRTPHSPNGAPKISSETPQGADPHEAFHPDLVNLADEPTNVRKGERCPSSPTAFPSSLTEKDKGERVGTRTHRLPPALQLVLQVLLLCAALPLPQTLFLSSYSLLPRSLPRGN